MSPHLTSAVVATTLAVGAVGFFVWKKTRRSYQEVAEISKIIFYPVKSLQGIEVAEAACTSLGLVVNGLLDRSFMLVTSSGVLVSQREQPTLALLAIRIEGNTLIISGPDCEDLRVDIKKDKSPNDKAKKYRLHSDEVEGIDCGDTVATWFQKYLKAPDVRLVRYFPDLATRKYLLKDPFRAKFRKQNNVGFPDLTALHILSEASVNDISSKVDEKVITYKNFRPNFLVTGCEPFDEDGWLYMKLDSGAEFTTVIPTPRCILTTNDPETGILTQKEPLVSMRKYRIPKSKEMVKKTGSIPCIGTSCSVTKCGTVKTNDILYAVVSDKPEMIIK